MAQKSKKELNFEQKHMEDLQRLQGFRLLDDDFMSKVFEDKKCTEFLLQIILNRKDLRVESIQVQYDIKNFTRTIYKVRYLSHRYTRTSL